MFALAMTPITPATSRQSSVKALAPAKARATAPFGGSSHGQSQSEWLHQACHFRVAADCKYQTAPSQLARVLSMPFEMLSKVKRASVTMESKISACLSWNRSSAPRYVHFRERVTT